MSFEDIPEDKKQSFPCDCGGNVSINEDGDAYECDNCSFSKPAGGSIGVAQSGPANTQSTAFLTREEFRDIAVKHGVDSNVAIGVYWDVKNAAHL